MKEAEKIIKTDLTKVPKPPYARGGDIFMAENGGGENMPSNSQPTNPEHAESPQAPKSGVEKPVSAERQAEVRKAWEEPDRGRVLSVDERRIRERIIKKGWPPNIVGGSQEPFPEQPPERISQEEASRRLEEAARQGQQRPPPETPQTAEAGGAEGGGRVPPAPPAGETPEERPSEFKDPILIKILGEIKGMDPDNPVYSEFLKDQIGKIDRFQETGSVNSDEADRLRNEIYLTIGYRMQSQFREDSSQSSALKDILSIDKFKDDTEKERMAIEALRDISTSEGLRTDLIDSIMEYDNALEYLVNRIISEPLDAETSGYQLSFYGGINFALIRDRMRVTSERYRRDAFNEGEVSSKPDEDKPNTKKAASKEGLSLKFEYMKSGAELFHNMNWKIVTGDIEQFVGVARGITVEHLQVLQRVDLAANVMRLYDQELQRVIGRDGKITPENYMEVAGTILDEEGNPTGRIQGSVEKLLTRYNESLPKEQQLESWQLKWAFYTGRNMMNITLRAAELIAQSKEIGYRSYVQESASRIVDPTNLTAERFGIAEPRGGVHFLSMAKEIFHEDKKRFGWLESGIKNMAGGDRKDFEARGIFNITGVWSGWRENNMIQLWDPNVDRSKDPDEPREKISVEELVIRLGVLSGEIGRAEALRKTFLNEGELKDEFCHSLGILLKVSDLLPSEADSKNKEVAEAKREIRTAIWRRTARENPLAMANFLRGMRFEEGKDLNARLENLDNLRFESKSEPQSGAKFKAEKRWKGNKANDKDVLVGEYRETGAWEGLRVKLSVAHEARMNRLGKGKLVSLEDVIDELKLEFDENEGKILKELRELGEIVAPKMAEVRFPSNPFMNDTLFENAQYTKAGAEFFVRRLGKDIPSLYTAGGNIPKLIDNPGGISEEDAFKIIAEMERALENPNGTVSGQDDVSPFFEAYIDWIKAGGNAENIPGVVKFFLQESALGINIGKMMKKHNSWAQVYAGPGAPADDLFQISKILDEALKMGILRRGTGRAGEDWTDMYERFRKKFKAKPLWFILRFLLDALPIFALGNAFDLGQKSVKEKG